MNRAKYRAMEIRHKNDLMHHGIDGQKWGVKHGPPYPLSRAESKAIRKRAHHKLKEGKKLTKKEVKVYNDYQTKWAKVKTYATGINGGLIGGALGGPGGAILGGAIGGAIGGFNEGIVKLQNDKRAGITTEKKSPKKTASDKYMERHKDEYEAKRKAREEKHAAEMAKYKDPEFRKKKYNDAKNNNSWDYAFAEFYFLNAHHRSEDKEPTTAEALKEYKKYLQDPDKWIQS